MTRFLFIIILYMEVVKERKQKNFSQLGLRPNEAVWEFQQQHRRLRHWLPPLCPQQPPRLFLNHFRPRHRRYLNYGSAGPPRTRADSGRRRSLFPIPQATIDPQ